MQLGGVGGHGGEGDGQGRRGEGSPEREGNSDECYLRNGLREGRAFLLSHQRLMTIPWCKGSLFHLVEKEAETRGDQVTCQGPEAMQGAHISSWASLTSGHHGGARVRSPLTPAILAPRRLPQIQRGGPSGQHGRWGDRPGPRALSAPGSDQQGLASTLRPWPPLPTATWPTGFPPCLGHELTSAPLTGGGRCGQGTSLPLCRVPTLPRSLGQWPRLSQRPQLVGGWS